MELKLELFRLNRRIMAETGWTPARLDAVDHFWQVQEEIYRGLWGLNAVAARLRPLLHAGPLVRRLGQAREHPRQVAGQESVERRASTFSQNYLPVKTKPLAASQGPVTGRNFLKDVLLQLRQLFQPEADFVVVLAGQVPFDQLPVEAGGAFLDQVGRLGAGEAAGRIGAISSGRSSSAARCRPLPAAKGAAAAGPGTAWPPTGRGNCVRPAKGGTPESISIST